MDNQLDSGATPLRLLLLVRQVTYEAVGVRSYELVDPAGAPLPPVSAGAHLDVYLGNGMTRQYSLCNDPTERHRYVIAVLHDEYGRGGSKHIHEKFQVQDLVTVGFPRNNFQLSSEARKHLLIAGGIGVTPMKAMAHQLATADGEYELHYCAKGPEFAAFRSDFERMFKPGRVFFHFDGGNHVDGLNIASLLREQPSGTHVYYCGPGGFMAACEKAAADWPRGTVHFEHFKPPVPVRPATSATNEVAEQPGPPEFSIKIASTGLVFDVPANRTIVEVLADAAITVETSCEAGLCATCKVRYVSGEVDHRDYVLSDEEHAEFFTACVSRSKSPMLVLDL